MILFKVYVDLTTESMPRPFYVGKGTVERVKRQVRNAHHVNIARKYGLDRRVVFETPDEQEALDLEVDLIRELKTFVYAYDYVFGANYTMGGDGVTGLKHSVASCEANRRAHTGITQSNVTRNKKSDSMKQSSRVKRRPVVCIDINENVETTFSSVTEAARHLGSESMATLISRCARGKTMSALGYCWRYVNDDGVTLARRPGGIKKPVLKLNRQGEVIDKYESLTAAARSVLGNSNSIRLCCDGFRQTAYGSCWAYENKEVK